MAAGLILLVAALAQPPVELADAVHNQRWGQVRTMSEDVAEPHPPAFAVAAARAARLTGRPLEARRIATNALPEAGELAPLLRLEAGEAQLDLGEDPWSLVRPLLLRGTPYSRRSAAVDLLERAWDALPLNVVDGYRDRRLRPPVRRRLRAVLACRHDDPAAAEAVLDESTSDTAAFRVATWLHDRAGVTPRQRVLAAEALLAGGSWREADALLRFTADVDDPDLRYRRAYVEGRVAYRLERMDAAAAAFTRALGDAPDDDARFSTSVQLARIAEIGGDFATASRFWRAARTATPDEPAGWEGEAKAAVAAGRATAVPELLRRAPRRARRTAAERLTAVLLLRGDVAEARTVLHLAGPGPRSAFLAVAVDLARSRLSAARRRAIQLIGDPRAGGWRELTLDLLSSGRDRPAAPPADRHRRSTRDPLRLAALAIHDDPGEARRALTAALATDPEWARLLAGELPEPATLPGPVADLFACGLESDAARFYAGTFPDGSPSELAWSATTLARWGNGPLALSYGERLWQRLGGVPASVVPDPLLPRILPPALVERVTTAADEAHIPAPLLVGVIRRESRFDSRARSAAGAVGMAQIVPETARRLGADVDDLWDENAALALAAAELARIRERFGDCTIRDAAAYNAGDLVLTSWLTATGDDAGGGVLAAAIPYKETSDYVLAVREGRELARYLE